MIITYSDPDDPSHHNITIDKTYLRYRNYKILCIGLENTCPTMANFNYKGQKPGLYCSKHKLEKMVDVNARMCMADKCGTQACYNYPGKTKRVYCFTHAKKGMVNLLPAPKCKYPGCTFEAHYTPSGKRGGRVYCKTHSTGKRGIVRNHK